MDTVPAKLRILLIEDQRSMAENIWEFLEMQDQVMDHAADGQTGLQLAIDNTYDVIVLDIGLPKLDGIEVCRRYRLSPAILHVGDLSLDVAARKAARQGELLNLSPAGYRLLEALMRSSPHVMRYAELAQALWGDSEHDPARLHTHVSLLRTAVDRAYEQPLILTVHGFGYRIVSSAAT
jgi:DNA-binding response OmpR family regulator